MKILLVSVLALLFLTGCAFMQGSVKPSSETAIVAVDLSASTIGYLVGKNNLEKIPAWNEWTDRVIAFKPGDSVLTFEELLSKGFAIVADSPFLEMQFSKLIRLFEFPELQPVNVPFLTKEYLDMVEIVILGFRDGLVVAQAEADL